MDNLIAYNFPSNTRTPHKWLNICTEIPNPWTNHASLKRQNRVVFVESTASLFPRLASPSRSAPYLEKDPVANGLQLWQVCSCGAGLRHNPDQVVLADQDVFRASDLDLCRPQPKLAVQYSVTGFGGELVGHCTHTTIS